MPKNKASDKFMPTSDPDSTTIFNQVNNLRVSPGVFLA